MATFEINGKEYELRLDYKAIKHLNNKFEGGSYELIGTVFQGDIELFPKIVHAALFHTKENISLKSVEERIEELVNSEEMTFDDIIRISDEVVAQSFFYEPVVGKMIKNNPEMKQALEQLRG